jgi:hypothetical protein
LLLIIMPALFARMSLSIYTPWFQNCWGWVWVQWKIFSVPHLFQEGWAAENLYTKLERLTVSCRGTWTWSDRVDS